MSGDRPNKYRARYPGTNVPTGGIAASGAVTPTSTTNVAITGLSYTLTASDSGATYLVFITADVLINTTGTVNIIELLVDGVAQSGSIQTSNGATGRATGAQMWLVSGLSAGSHTFTGQTRNTAGATSATINATHTKLVVVRVS